MSYAEIFLLAWAIFASVLYVVTKHNATHFKAHTLFKLKMVAEGKAKIVLGDDYIAIETKEKA